MAGRPSPPPGGSCFVCERLLREEPEGVKMVAKNAWKHANCKMSCATCGNSIERGQRLTVKNGRSYHGDCRDELKGRAVADTKCIVCQLDVTPGQPGIRPLGRQFRHETCTPMCNRCGNQILPGTGGLQIQANNTTIHNTCPEQQPRVVGGPVSGARVNPEGFGEESTYSPIPSRASPPPSTPTPQPNPERVVGEDVDRSQYGLVHRPGGRPTLAPGRPKLVPGRPKLVPGRPKLTPGRPKLVPGRPKLTPDRSSVVQGIATGVVANHPVVTAAPEMAPAPQYPGAPGVALGGVAPEEEKPVFTGAKAIPCLVCKYPIGEEAFSVIGTSRKHKKCQMVCAVCNENILRGQNMSVKKGNAYHKECKQLSSTPSGQDIDGECYVCHSPFQPGDVISLAGSVKKHKGCALICAQCNQRIERSQVMSVKGDSVYHHECREAIKEAQARAVESNYGPVTPTGVTPGDGSSADEVYQVTPVSGTPPPSSHYGPMRGGSSGAGSPALGHSSDRIVEGSGSFDLQYSLQAPEPQKELSPPPPPSETQKESPPPPPPGDGGGGWATSGPALPPPADFTSGQKDRFLVDLNKVTKLEKLGEGAFGEVFRGKWRRIEVAVKVLLNFQEEAARDEFLAEARLAASLRPHPNVTQIYGYAFEPCYAMLSEFVARGSLDKMLEAKEVPLEQGLSYILDISRGMLHLAEEQIIHKDLAARNVLIDNHFTAKICDFGNARQGDERNQHMTKSDTGPLKWMAPESINDKLFSEKTDVWMFGVTCLEILTQDFPYPTLDALKVCVQVAMGRLRPEFPADLLDPRMLTLLNSCVAYDESDRPGFEAIVDAIEEVLGA